MCIGGVTGRRLPGHRPMLVSDKIDVGLGSDSIHQLFKVD